MLETYHSSLIMLAKVLCNNDITGLAVFYRRYCKKLQKHHGRKFMVNRMKDLLQIAERYSLYQPIEALVFVKSDKEHFPDVIKAFKPYLRSNNETTRIIVLSIFRSVELFRLEPSHDISSVTNAANIDMEVLNDILAFIPGWVKSLNKTLTYPKMKYHFTVKNGPNGRALLNSDSDITALDNDAKLLEKLQVISSELDDEFPLTEDYHRDNICDNNIHSKLTQFSEKSGKTRTIAVIDYYSQRALLPLHSGLMKLLSSLETDGTSSHENVGNYVKELTKNKSFVRTFDLTAFTDRFPREIQETLLHCLVNNQTLSTAWWTLLSQRTFTVAWSGEQVTYAAGQPMGAYASWPLCTLAHHAVVEYCRTKRQYRLIGDDVAIADKRSANRYECIISALGVETNPYKGTNSEEGNLFSSAEIAKRLYLNGSNVSPLTPGLLKSLKNRYLFLEGIKELQARFNEPTLPRQLVEFNFPKGEIRDYVWCLVCNPLNGAIKPSDEGYNELSSWADFDIDVLKYKFKLIRMKNLANQAMKLYLDSMPTGTYLASWASLNAGYLDVQSFTGENWQLPTIQPEAMVLARRELLFSLFKGLELLADIDPSNEDELMNLQAVEYLPNPDDPFRDQKELRKIRMSSLIHELYEHMINCGDDTATLSDEIEIPPYLTL